MATCFEPGGHGRRLLSTTTIRTTKELVFTGLGNIMTSTVGYSTRFLILIASIMNLVYPNQSSHCACTACKSHAQSEEGSFMGKIRTVLPYICFAPFSGPKRLWRSIYPQPCNHNRCTLRRYVSPPPPWYRPLEHVYLSVPHQLGYGTESSSPQESFPLFDLPLELRNLIYLHASNANGHSIQVSSQWRAEKLTQQSCGFSAAATLIAEHDAAIRAANTRRAVRSEDNVLYPLNDNGIIAIHGSWLPTNLLLASKKIYEEAYDAYWSKTAFEVQPLTPNDACWRLDQSLQPTYKALAMSNHVKHIRKLRVRIDLSRMSVGRRSMRFERVNTQVCTFTEIGLQTCVERLTPLAEGLCEVLERSAPSLRVVEIVWVDDYPEDVSEMDLQARADILVPFTSLKAQVRVIKLAVAQRSRRSIMTLLKQALEGNR